MTQIKSQYLYKAFGLLIKSDIVLPELTQISTNQDSFDVSIETSDLTTLWNESDTNPKRFFVKENLVLFHIDDTAIFCIKNGNKIIVSPMELANMDKARLYILGTCMGVILLQRQILALHGSAIEIDGKAYAFIGESGAGKSTLAQAFINKGYRLLSDDVIPVSLSNEGIPFVIPSYPQQKLWQESLDSLGMDNTNFQPLFERETKFAIPVHSSFINQSLPLAGVFELGKTDSEEITIRRIENLERFKTLFTHTYRSTLITRLSLTEWHFNESANILKQIDLYKLSRPTNQFTVQELVNLILTEVGKESIQYV